MERGKNFHVWKFNKNAILSKCNHGNEEVEEKFALVHVDCCRFSSQHFISLLPIALSNHVYADFLMQLEKYFSW